MEIQKSSEKLADVAHTISTIHKNMDSMNVFE